MPAHGQGPVTESYGKEPDEVIGILNEVLATEIVCWMRYSRHAISAAGINRAQVSGEFTEHADEERQHAMWAAERITPTRRSSAGSATMIPTTRRLLEKILAQEEEHADDIADLLCP
jgi:bacterioferritin (cytochrome b1)